MSRHEETVEKVLQLLLELNQQNEKDGRKDENEGKSKGN